MPYLNTNGITTYYEIYGRGRPIIFLHGAMMDHHMWYPQISEFSEKYQVIVYDLRGHGKTGPSSAPSYTLNLLAEDLLDLLLSLNLQRPVLCGFSFGGLVAQQFTDAHPDLVSGLILCDSSASTTLTLQDKIQTYLLRWSIASSLRIFGAQLFTNYTFWLSRVARRETWFGRVSPTRAYIRQCMRSIPTGEMIKIFRMIFRFRGSNPSCIHVPTLLINGRQPSEKPAKQTGLRLNQSAYDPLEMIPNAGHTTNLETPEKFNLILHNFLSVLSPGTLQRENGTRTFAWRQSQRQPSIPRSSASD